MKIAVAMLISVNVGAATTVFAGDQPLHSTGQPFQSKLSGKIETAGSNVSGTITINFGPAPPAKDMDKMMECGAEWNQKLARYDEMRKRGAKLDPLTRLDYRNCMYQCLGALTTRECKADLPSDVQAPN
jgi:hypothetical protein